MRDTRVSAQALTRKAQENALTAIRQGMRNYS